MRHVAIALFIGAVVIGCGVVQIKTKKKFDSNPPTVDAPADADPRIRSTWNKAELARARTLRDEDKPRFIRFGSYYGPCRGYIDVYNIDPDFTAGTMFQKVTVRARMEEMCRKAVDYAEWCRGQGKTQGCGDAAAVSHIIAVLEGRPPNQQQPAAAQARPAAPPATTGGAMIQQEAAGRQLLAQAKEVSRQRATKQITTCETLAKLSAIELQIPPDVRELFRATMNLERIPPEGIRGFVHPDQIEAARASTGEQRKIILAGVEMHLRSNAPAHQRDYKVCRQYE